MKQEKSFRPLARLGWFPTHFKHLKAISVIQFPAPLEGWVGSCPNSILKMDITKSSSFRPLSRLGEFPTVGFAYDLCANLEFPAPLEVWVGSYPTFPTNLSLNEDSFPAPIEAWGVSYKNNEQL